MQVSDLLHLHERTQWIAKNGANGNPAEGTAGPKKRDVARSRAPSLKVPVPMGTLVKDKRGKKIGELVQQGDILRVCQGGQGGRGTVEPAPDKAPRPQSKKLQVRNHVLLPNLYLSCWLPVFVGLH